jgi:hypothetical protein
MAKAAARPKPKSDKSNDKMQTERFKETARKLGGNESRKEFERAFAKIVPPKKRFQP